MSKTSGRIAHASATAEAMLSNPPPIIQDSATDPRPETPPPVLYCRAVQTDFPASQNAGVQVQPLAASIGCLTGEVPRPWLTTPEVNIRQLARHQVLLGEEEPLCDIQQLADQVVQASGMGGNAPQRRVVSIMVNYAAEVLRAASELLLNQVSARYGNDPAAPYDRMWCYSMEQLAVWNGRRGLPQDMPQIREEDLLEWL